MCLALLHHLCISNNTPLDYVAKLFSEHCEHLIIEWVPPDDPKTATIAFNRVFPRYNLDVFKSAFSDYFTIEKERPLADSKRIVYLMEKR
jgi:8-oxo-dGTP pyrophosphatase MutT (NUDIX family)